VKTKTDWIDENLTEVEELTLKLELNGLKDYLPETLQQMTAPQYRRCIKDHTKSTGKTY
jgi:hypothetical protein